MATKQSPKQILRKIIGNDEDIKSKRIAIADEYYKMEGVGATEYESDKVQSSVTNAQEDRILKGMDRVQDLKDKIDVLENERAGIIEAIDKIPDPKYRSILYLRYVVGFDFYQIADTLHYSERHCKRLHGEALNLFDEQYKPSQDVP